MTIATLMATAAVFLVQGWTAPAFGALAITIGGVVCIAASNSGDTSQDLKTGYIIGATPRAAADRADDRRGGFDAGDWSDTEPDEHGAAGVPRCRATVGHPYRIPAFQFNRTCRHLPPQIRVVARRQDRDFAPVFGVCGVECDRVYRIAGREVSLLARDGEDRGALDSGHRQRCCSRAAGATDGDSDQRNPEPQAAVGTGPARRVAGDCSGVAGDSLADIRRGRVSADRHDAANLCRRRGALDRRPGGCSGPEMRRPRATFRRARCLLRG